MLLAVCVFSAICTEMLPVGLLPEIGRGLRVSTSGAGVLVSLYAVLVALTTVPIAAFVELDGDVSSTPLSPDAPTNNALIVREQGRLRPRGRTRPTPACGSSPCPAWPSYLTRSSPSLIRRRGHI